MVHDVRDTLAKITNAIKPVDKKYEAQAQARLDNLTKPKDSLGRLEDLARDLYCLRKTHDPDQEKIFLSPARIYTVAADHGVAAQTGEVSLYPQAVTRQMVQNFLSGGAAVNVLARTCGADLFVVDAGVAGEEFPDTHGLVRAKVAPGTRDLRHEPAMTDEQCALALSLGASLAKEAAEQNVRTLLTGEMGIGNTTASTALFCAYFGLEPEAISGPGTGLDQEGVSRKAKAVAQALKIHEAVVASQDPAAILAALGGLEIATLAGLILGGAAQGQAVIIDGFIATAACAAAWKIAPQVKDYCFFAHASAEPGHAKALKAMGAKPLLDLGLRLGEGTGAALALTLLRSAGSIFNDMATFGDAGVSTAE